MTQSNDLPAWMNRAEDNIIDLRLAVSAMLQAIDKNSADIAALIEVSRRNGEGILVLRETTADLREATAALQVSQLRTEAALQVFQQHTDAAIERLTASNERMERLFEYLIRRDQGQSD
jgi:hypothetical protein